MVLEDKRNTGSEMLLRVGDRGSNGPSVVYAESVNACEALFGVVPVRNFILLSRLRDKTDCELTTANEFRLYAF